MQYLRACSGFVMVIVQHHRIVLYRLVEKDDHRMVINVRARIGLALNWLYGYHAQLRDRHSFSCVARFFIVYHDFTLTKHKDDN